MPLNLLAQFGTIDHIWHNCILEVVKAWNEAITATSTFGLFISSSNATAAQKAISVLHDERFPFTSTNAHYKFPSVKCSHYCSLLGASFLIKKLRLLLPPSHLQ